MAKAKARICLMCAQLARPRLRIQAIEPEHLLRVRVWGARLGRRVWGSEIRFGGHDSRALSRDAPSEVNISGAGWGRGVWGSKLSMLGAGVGCVRPLSDWRPLSSDWR